ncbi:hypothetical protein [Nibribacter koreensis]
MKKTLFLAILTTILSGSVTSVFGQNYQTQAANLLANQHMHRQMHQQTQMMLTMSMAEREKSFALKNPLSTYIVVMKDSTVKKMQGKIRFDWKNSSYLETLDLSKKLNDPARNLKIYPQDTRSITKVFTNKKQSVPGIPTGNCWLFKSVEGKINAYSFLPAPQNTASLPSGYFKFFQKGEGKMQVLQQDSLLVMMHDNEKAKNILKKETPYEALLEYNKQPKVK